MIRTYKEIRDSETGTVCEITGNKEEVYNDFRSIIDTVYDHDDLAEILIDAWNKIIEERGLK